jgi:hypothetical protein
MPPLLAPQLLSIAAAAATTGPADVSLPGLDRLGGEGLVALAIIALLGNIALRIVSMVLDRKQRSSIAAAAACNMPAELAIALKAATERQSTFAHDQLAAIGALQEAVATLVSGLERSADRQEVWSKAVVDALTQNTIRLVETLTYMQARGGGDNGPRRRS